MCYHAYYTIDDVNTLKVITVTVYICSLDGCFSCIFGTACRVLFVHFPLLAECMTSLLHPSLVIFHTSLNAMEAQSNYNIDDSSTVVNIAKSTPLKYLSPSPTPSMQSANQGEA